MSVLQVAVGDLVQPSRGTSEKDLGERLAVFLCGGIGGKQNVPSSAGVARGWGRRGTLIARRARVI